MKFDLPIKNYDTLRRADHINPHYLVLVLLHEDSSRWLSISPSELAICGTAIYGDFCGLPSVPNTATRTVTLPQNQRFNAEVLRQMIKWPLGELVRQEANDAFGSARSSRNGCAEPTRGRWLSEEHRVGTARRLWQERGRFRDSH